MRSSAACLICALTLSAASWSQTFEAANVQPHPAHSNRPFISGGLARNGQFILRAATMLDLIAEAYKIQPDNILGGPSWLEIDRYDIIAKAPARSTVDGVRPMLKALLADRFHLVIHDESKPMPAYALTAKHPSFKKAGESAETGCKTDIKDGNTNPTIYYTCHSVTMADFAANLRGLPAAQQYLTDVQVVDKTGMDGTWDLSFNYNVRGPAVAAGVAVVSIPDAIEKQLGLKLEATTLPRPVQFIEKVDHLPTPNPPNTAEILATLPSPTEFDVADLKPTPEDVQGTRFQLLPGGKVNIEGAPLSQIIQVAWGMSNETMVNVPKWMESERYSIIAKAPTFEVGNGPTASNRPAADVESLLQMLRTMITERFHLKVHKEDRPISAYTLLSLKPKMKPADPKTRTKFKEGPAALGGRDPRNSNPALSRLVACQNMTMAQFAQQLQFIAGGYIHYPVLDSTGIEGSYDFTLSFTPIGLLNQGAGAGRGGDAPPAGSSPNVIAASDPGTGISLFDAIEKQLGLKLVQQKRPVEVLVIDSADRKPADN